MVQEHKRPVMTYTNKSESFLNSTQNFQRQFAGIYAARLAKMTDLMTKQALDKWGNKYSIKKLQELKEDEPEKCIIIGTFFKHQELKPSILKEISEENQMAPPPVRTHYTEEKDLLILEDDLQRIRLMGKIDVHSLSTGVVSAVLGYETGDGKFEVEDFLFYNSGPEKPLATLDNSPLIVFISGLNLSHTENIPNSLYMLEQWIYGNSKTQTDASMQVASNQIVRIIVAGNSISTTLMKEIKNTNALTTKTFDNTDDVLESVKVLDNFMFNLSKSVHVDLMSGEYDPSNCMLPQQPMHHSLFPQSATNKTFHGVSNPYKCEIGGRDILGTAGQNIQDLARFTNISGGLECMKKTLDWSHLAPTCPDTLSCYPFYDKDPFIIEECPHIYFCGNADKFETEIYKSPNNQSVRLVCVPSFHESQTAVVLNLNNLDCYEIVFGGQHD